MRLWINHLYKNLIVGLESSLRGVGILNIFVIAITILYRQFLPSGLVVDESEFDVKKSFWTIHLLLFYNKKGLKSKNTLVSKLDPKTFSPTPISHLLYQAYNHHLPKLGNPSVEGIDLVIASSVPPPIAHA